MAKSRAEGGSGDLPMVFSCGLEFLRSHSGELFSLDRNVFVNCRTEVTIKTAQGTIHSSALGNTVWHDSLTGC